MANSIAIVGATGVVGREMLRVLEERAFPLRSLRLLASARSLGSSLFFSGQAVPVEEATESAFAGVDIALFSAGAAASRTLAPLAARAGAIVIDNSSAWRMDPDVPLVVPEVNAHALTNIPKGIVANPNCSTIQMVVALAPLHRVACIRHIVVSTYQAASGKGRAAVDELEAQTRAHASGAPLSSKVFPRVLLHNTVMDWAAANPDDSEEELKMVNETRKILGAPELLVSPTTVRVPVVTGHAESVYVEFEREISPAQAKALLKDAPGVHLTDAPYAPGGPPGPRDAAGQDAVFVARVRQTVGLPRTLRMWIVADNLRKGAALNAVQIAERLPTRQAR